MLPWRLIYIVGWAIGFVIGIGACECVMAWCFDRERRLIWSDARREKDRLIRENETLRAVRWFR